MGYPTKVQLIKRKNSEQWYIGFPAAVARAMEFTRSEVVEWIIEDKKHLVLRRTSPPPSAMKKNGRRFVRPLGKPVAAMPRGVRTRAGV